MIADNITVFNERGRILMNAIGNVRKHFQKFKNADDFATLTVGQKTQALADYANLKTAYMEAKVSFEEADSATKPL